MTKEEREMILNLSYQELIEKFKNEPQILIKFLREEQKNDKFYFRSGGGITIQSQLEDEYQELIAKVYLPIQKEK